MHRNPGLRRAKESLKIVGADRSVSEPNRSVPPGPSGSDPPLIAIPPVPGDARADKQTSRQANKQASKQASKGPGVLLSDR